MNEHFLHFVWQYQLFENLPLKSIKNETIKILKTGTHNTHSGPDFSMAKIDIDGTVLAGNIEIHVKTSDWFKHQHQKDKKYENIILHVVFEHDVLEENFNFPVVSLQPYLQQQVIYRYKNIIEEKGWIPCNGLINTIEPFKFKAGLQSIAIERLIDKSKHVFDLLKKNENNWEETLYQSVARSFGLKINADAFERLAFLLPQKIIGKHKNNLLQIEALLFGTAGFLDETYTQQDDYYISLKKEYHFLQKKYKLSKMEAHEWHFLRLRPASFPTIRIAQFAMLLFQSHHLFSKIKEAGNAKNLIELFNCHVSPYWLTHYHFNSISKSKDKKLGNATIQLIILNSVVPVLFAYGYSLQNEHVKEKAISLLEALPSEKNEIIEKWAALKYKAQNAMESQALIQLKNGYCNQKKCLQCHVGIQVLKK